MILKYIDHNGKEVIVKNVISFRKGFTFCEYSISPVEVVEFICERFWLGNDDT